MGMMVMSSKFRIKCNCLRRDHLISITTTGIYTWMIFFSYYYCKAEVDVPVRESYADAGSQTHLVGLCFHSQQQVKRRHDAWLVASLVRGIQNRGVNRVPTYCKNTSGALNIICRFHQCRQRMSYSTPFTLNWINCLRKMLQKAMCAKAKCIWWLQWQQKHIILNMSCLTAGVTRGTPAKSLKAK